MLSRYPFRLLLRLIFIHLLAFHLFSAAFAQTEPVGLLLTWQQDPTSTMTIDWHTLPSDKAINTLNYRKDGEETWLEVYPRIQKFPHSDRTIHRVEIKDLTPGSHYEFRVGEFTRVYSFHTMPAKNDRPIRFAAGGDTSQGEMFRKMNQSAMRYNPDFIVWGGDLAYAHGQKENIAAWYQWFDGVKRDLILKMARWYLWKLVLVTMM